MKQKWIATADSFADALAELGAKYTEIVLLDVSSDGDALSECFRRAFRERYRHCAEENVMCIASELAYAGCVPFVFTRIDAVPPAPKRTDNVDNPNIKIVVISDGILPEKSPAGNIAPVYREPDAITICPSDATEARAALKASYAHRGTVYLRLSKQAVPIFHAESFPFEIGKGEVVACGNDIAIVANGIATHTALKASKSLAAIGIHAMVINMATVQPLDERLLLAAAKKCGKVILCEETSVTGSLCKAAAAALGEISPTDVAYIGISANTGKGAGAAPEKRFPDAAEQIFAMAIKLLKKPGFS